MGKRKLAQGLTWSIRYAVANMLVCIKFLLNPARIKDVEYFIDPNTGLVIDYICRLRDTIEWGFFEFSLGYAKDGSERITQVRVMKKVTDAPVVSDIMQLDDGMEPISYHGKKFKFIERRTGICKVLTPTNLRRDGSSGNWLVFEAKVGKTTYVLVYATFGDDPTVHNYAGQVVKKKDVWIGFAEMKGKRK
jgi:hypothetical protein